MGGVPRSEALLNTGWAELAATAQAKPKPLKSWSYLDDFVKQISPQSNARH